MEFESWVCGFLSRRDSSRRTAADLVAVLGPRRRGLGHAGEDDVLGLDVDERGEEPGRLRLGMDDLVEDGLGVSREGQLAGDRFEQDHAQRVDVSGGRTRGVEDRLGRKVGQSADDDVGLGHARVLGPKRDAEVHQLGPPLFALADDHDVLGLDVAVDDPALVRVVEGLRHLRADLENLEGLECLLLLDRAQRLALDVGHDEEEVALVVREVEDRNDAGVIELGDGARLAFEPLPLVSLEVPRGEHLDRDFPFENGVARQIHHSHAPSTDLSEDFVSRREFSTDHRVLANHPVPEGGILPKRSVCDDTRARGCRKACVLISRPARSRAPRSGAVPTPPRSISRLTRTGGEMKLPPNFVRPRSFVVLGSIAASSSSKTGAHTRPAVRIGGPKGREGRRARRRMSPPPRETS